MAVAWTLALVLLPTWLGTELLGEVWGPAREVVPLWGVAFAVVNLSAGAAIGLRALAAARRTLLAAAVTSVLSFSGAVIGAYLGGVVGAGWGYLAAWGVGLALWWWEFRRGVRQFETDGAPVGGWRDTGAVIVADPT